MVHLKVGCDKIKMYVVIARAATKTKFRKRCKKFNMGGKNQDGHVFSKWPKRKNTSLLEASSSTESLNVGNHQGSALSPFFISTFAAYKNIIYSHGFDDHL